MAGESIRFNASLNTAGFDSGAARLQQIAAATSGKVSASFASMGAKIASVIAPFVGLYAAINSVKNALDMGGRLNDLSKTTGETAGNLAILERAFANAGVGSEKLGPALAAVANFVTDLGNAMPGAEMAASALKVSLDDLAGKSPIQQMRVLLAAIAAIPDPSKRAALAIDVFKKAGRDIVPLAKDFSIELANARGELGSLPRILTENATSLDDLGDKLTNSVGNKLTELAVGLAAGATGADNFVAALSKIDAAGIGERLGNALRAAFAAPLEVLQGIGDFLISGVLKAGNALVAALKYAVEVFYNLLTSSEFWSGVSDRISGGLAKLGAGFSLVIVDGIKSAMESLKNVPFLGRFTEQASKTLEEIKNQILEASETATMRLEYGSEVIAEAWNEAKTNARFVYEDSLGAERYAQSASDHWQNARSAAEQIKNNSAETAENFGRGSAALTKALNDIRGFSLGNKDDEEKPNWFESKDAPPTATVSTRGSGGATKAPLSINERTAEMRADSRASFAEDRAGRYEQGRMFRSAARAEAQARDIRSDTMEGQRMRDTASQFEFSGRRAGNIGEAFKSVTDKIGKMSALDRVRNTPGFDRNKGPESLDNIKNAFDKGKFDEVRKAASKTPQERRKEEEEMRERSRPPGGGGDSQRGKEQSETVLQEILTEIRKRLPIVALGT